MSDFLCSACIDQTWPDSECMRLVDVCYGCGAEPIACEYHRCAPPFEASPHTVDVHVARGRL